VDNLTSQQQSIVLWAISLLENPTSIDPETQIAQGCVAFYKQSEADASEILAAAQKQVAGKKIAAAQAQWSQQGGASAQGVDGVESGKPQAEFVDPLPEFPASLKALRRWVRWRLEIGTNGEPTKVPYRVDGRKAASTKQEDWTDYRTIVSAWTINETQGVGLVVNGDGILGVDLDGCRNPQTGEIAEWAERIVEFCNSYTEITPSQAGLRVWLRGVIPDADKVFNLDPVMGFGDKVKIEVFETQRYFTVTGDPFFEEAGDIESVDMAALYQMLHDIRAKYPKPKSAKDSTAVDAGEGTKIELVGTFATTKYDIFMNGEIETDKPFIISNRIGRLTYPSHSEADLAFATVLAIYHDCDTAKMSADFRASRSMWRPKMERLEESTFAKAIATAGRIKAETLTPYPAQAPTTSALAAAPVATDVEGLEEKDIPPYSPAIECGFFKEVIDAVCNGTTIPRQFMHNVIKTFVGALASGKLRFDGIDCNSCRYGVNIGESGTSKRTVWDRGISGIFSPLIVERGDGNLIKVYDGADSGAGLRDAFFDSPKDAPILLMIDEAESLGNKSAETKNPEIIDTIIELADSTTVSRVKAKKSQKSKAAKVHSDARLAMYLCAQTGEVVTQAFQGRKKQGINERLSIEYSPAIEPGDLPVIPAAAKLALVDQLVKLLATNSNWKEPMTMTGEAKEYITGFWNNQPQEVRQKIRLRKNLWLDIFLRAFSRGEGVATVGDAQLCAEHFERDKAIRAVHFRGEISNKVGLYVKRLKEITDTMRAQMNKGLPVGAVALSKRDLQTKTNAFRDNEIDFFERALVVFGKAHLWQVSVKASNGQTYTKFIPMAYETETWNQLGEDTFQEFKG
jgi:hypothetical protein